MTFALAVEQASWIGHDRRQRCGLRVVGRIHALLCEARQDGFDAITGRVIGCHGYVLGELLREQPSSQRSPLTCTPR